MVEAKAGHKIVGKRRLAAVAAITWCLLLLQLLSIGTADRAATDTANPLPRPAQPGTLSAEVRLTPYGTVVVTQQYAVRIDGASDKKGFRFTLPRSSSRQGEQHPLEAEVVRSEVTRDGVLDPGFERIDPKRSDETFAVTLARTSPEWEPGTYSVLIQFEIRNAYNLAVQGHTVPVISTGPLGWPLSKATIAGVASGELPMMPQLNVSVLTPRDDGDGHTELVDIIGSIQWSTDDATHSPAISSRTIEAGEEILVTLRTQQPGSKSLHEHSVATSERLF